MIGDEEMPKIIWKGIIKSEKDFPTADIPKNAKKLDSEEDMKKIDEIKARSYLILENRGNGDYIKLYSDMVGGF